MAFFIWIENTALSEWIRGTPSLWGFPFILYLHTLGLALIAGLSSAVALTILYLPATLERAPLARLFPWMWAGLAINVVSGLLLLIAYPAKALTNPVFYAKLIAIAIAVGIVQWLQRQLASGDGIDAVTGAGAASADLQARLTRAAWALLGLWLIATVTGRFLAYTHSILMARDGLMVY